MAEKQNIPEIRFEGFTDPWEQRKLGDIAHRVTRKNEGESDLPLTISAQFGLIDQRSFFNSQVASKNMNGYYLLRKGEFAYNKSTSSDSPWGAVKRLEKYKTGCVSTLYICFGLEGADPDYLVSYYETDRWHKGIQMVAAEGARNHGLLNIAPDDFFETKLSLPKTMDEQRVIGTYFSSLDSLITLHQRECRKASFIRPSAWEQRKLGEVATRHDNLRIPITAKDRIPGDTPYYGANGIQDYVEGYTHEGEFVLVAEDGATDLDNYPVQLISGLSWVNNHAHVIKAIPDVAQNRFIMHLIKSMDIASYLVGGTRSKLNAEVLMGIELKLPSNSEQIYIGSLLSTLDSLITLHQCEPRVADTGYMRVERALMTISMSLFSSSWMTCR